MKLNTTGIRAIPAPHNQPDPLTRLHAVCVSICSDITPIVHVVLKTLPYLSPQLTPARTQEGESPHSAAERWAEGRGGEAPAVLCVWLAMDMCATRSPVRWPGWFWGREWTTLAHLVPSFVFVSPGIQIQIPPCLVHSWPATRLLQQITDVLQHTYLLSWTETLICCFTSSTM